MWAETTCSFEEHQMHVKVSILSDIQIFIHFRNIEKVHMDTLIASYSEVHRNNKKTKIKYTQQNCIHERKY